MNGEVQATTRNKTIKKATPQTRVGQSSLLDKGLGPAQKSFTERVMSQINDPSTRADVLKAAGVPQAAKITRLTKPAKKQKPKPTKRQLDLSKPSGSVERKMAVLKAAGYTPAQMQRFLSKEADRRLAEAETDRRKEAAQRLGTPP